MRTLLLTFVTFSFIFTACSQEPQSPTLPVTIVAPSENPTTPPISGYPIEGETDTSIPGYPVNDLGEILDTPPNPEVELPAADGSGAVIGGILVRELIESGGFQPFDPYQLILGEQVHDDLGEPAFIRYNDNSARAETFASGVFVFRGVPSGTYGLIINLGFTEFPVIQEDGSYLLIMVEENEVRDLGQVFVQVP